MPSLPEPVKHALADIRASRRAAIAGGLASALTLAGASRAQDATPEPAVESAEPTFLFVQLAESGTWVPSASDPDVYELTLTGVGSQVAFFSDRPERIVGTVDTDRFLRALGFTPANPPNAAAVVRTPEGERDVLVIELFDPVYSREFDADGGGSVTYRARVLEAYHGENLTSWYDEQDDPALPSRFDQVSLFIDDCPNITSCVGPKDPSAPWVSTPLLNYGPIPGGPYGACWDWNQFWCEPCSVTQDQLRQICNAKYPGCQNACDGEAV